ncbi:MAG TPA: N(4)-(beta-N-acetylglucosaminyl)-L-asparaginase, partial [Thermomicrobiales bacterium]|nr:N(4)-(beta-N-acetylglucosaminyl)-L-asparaginase [Thermomicrobiales bacterium]
MLGTVIASANGSVGIERAVEVLRTGGSAVDAVTEGIKLVEANPEDHTVGYSGLPNLLGEVELDASIMDGNGLRAGSVGALHGYQDAIELARKVMEDLPHVLIVGAGADRFAAEVGLPPTDLLTDAAREIWQARLDGAEPVALGGQNAYYERMRDVVKRMTADPEKPKEHHGTVNFIARDHTGNIACGVSTSGWAWKYPGRLGDSPIIGAGNYADNRWGAAACTGRGEMAQRCCTAHSVVMFMRFGMDLDEAVRTAMLDLRALDDPYASEMNIIAMDRQGNYSAASTSADKTYVFMTEDMESFIEERRRHVPL